MRNAALALFLLCTPSFAANICRISAPVEGTKSTRRLQHALDTCTTVEVAPGMYITGPLSLHTGTVLDLAPGATLLGSPDRSDYPAFTFARKQTVQPLISAVNAENVTLTGGGVIDGNGQIWWDYVKGVKDSGVLGTYHPRPMGILLDHVKHARVENITMQNAGFWQIVPYYSDDITFRNVRVLAPHSPNTDAIDPFSSSHIVIDHVFSSVGDDNIAIKSGAINSPGPDAPSDYITITDCTFENGHGLSIGSEIAGGAHHIHVERIHFKGTDQGIRIKANRDRGNDVSDISFKDIDMDGVKTPILISEYYPAAYPAGDVAAAPVTRLTPHFHDISIENVTAVNSGADGIIVGLPESPVVDIRLKNVHIEGRTGMRIAYARVQFSDVTFKATEGESLIISPTATVSGK
jgi:polygalacturonase